MLKKVYNGQGQKAYQRDDLEDRSLPYRNWMRTVNTNGFYVDVDLIKWRTEGDKLKPIAITEITRCDSETVSKKYLDAITYRLFVRDKQGIIMKTLGEMLNIPVYLVLFQKDIKWLYVFSFNLQQWRLYTPKQWEEYLFNL